MPTNSILFRQERVGLDGKTFTLYKFRTMRPDAEKNGPQFSVEGDPRVTRVGRFLRKTHLDELPQLWNIIKGDMALVGPRPERPEFHERFVREIPGWEKRLAVKPGLTSLACVRNGYANCDKAHWNKLKYDLFYIRRKSLWFDSLIFARTILYCLMGER